MYDLLQLLADIVLAAEDAGDGQYKVPATLLNRAAEKLRDAAEIDGPVSPSTERAACCKFEEPTT